MNQEACSGASGSVEDGESKAGTAGKGSARFLGSFWDFWEKLHITQMCIPLKPVFSRHKGGGVQITDEPTGNLDSRSSEAVIQSFIEAKKTLGATILMVTHDTFSASYCDRVIMMKDGRVHSELTNHGDRKAFLTELLNVLRELNGGENDDAA